MRHAPYADRHQHSCEQQTYYLRRSVLPSSQWGDRPGPTRPGRSRRGEQEEGFELAPVEDRDDRDGEQVIDDGQGEQERSQGGGQWWVLMTASTASANAISVAVGMAHPCRASPPVVALTATKIRAGTAIQLRAAATGRAALRGSRRSPARNSRLSSSPATKKKMASKPVGRLLADGEVQVQPRFGAIAQRWSVLD